MIAPIFLFGLAGLGFFYLQNLVFLPHVYLRLLPLLIFQVALRPSLSLALTLGLGLGLLLDSYATTPIGLHLGGSLLLVAAARFGRRLQLQSTIPLVLASLAALVLQEVWLQVIVFLLESQSFQLTDLLGRHGMEILATAALGPIMYHIVRGLEKFLGRLGWRPTREAFPFQPFHDF